MEDVNTRQRLSFSFPELRYSLLEFNSKRIDLVTVFDAILMNRQTRKKLQCLYKNLMSNNFRKTAVLENIRTVNSSFTLKDSTEKI